MERILTGMRPTGNLHLGHYAGALENWLALQNQYECFFLIADYQAMSDHVNDVEGIRRSIAEITLDWLAVGLDPEHSSFVIQSYVPEHAELTMFMSMLTPLNRLQRNPTLKAEMDQLRGAREEISAGFFNYPISQVADILLAKGNLVPVGEDQVPHIEFTRELARKFNRAYGEIFPEPKALVGRVPRLVGTDGQAKMSKSLDNAIYLSDDAGTVETKIKGMVTDITGRNPRLRATDPGIPEENPVFFYHEAFNDSRDEVEELQNRYRSGTVSDREVKISLVQALNRFLDPIRERRAYFEERPSEIKDALELGTNRASAIAKETMGEVREAMRVLYF